MIKRVIFTSYDDLHNDDLPHESQAKQLLVEEYFDRLVQNKKDYADSIGVDFMLYRNTMNDFELDKELEFTRTNLHKHHLMLDLSDKYDEVMYVDMDVVFNTNLNVFTEHDISKGIHFKDTNDEIYSKEKHSMLFGYLGLRNPTLKYHITKDLLDGKDNNVINTGVIIGSSKHIKQLNFIENSKEAINKINDLKNAKTAIIEKQYYPNNESIFSYIIEKYNIPYVILEDEWHNILNEKPKDVKGHCLHFINKQFNAFFKDKTQCIFSIHIEIPDDRLDNPKNYNDSKIPKSLMVKQQLIKYYDNLIANHSEYASNISATYKHYGRDDKYESFKARFPDLSEYDVVNLYKIYLLDELTHEYDHVAYVDLDVYFRQQYNIFDYFPLDYAICCKYATKKDLMIPAKNLNLYFKVYDYDFRNQRSKYWNTHALLVENGLNGDNNVFNTGVVCASRYGMEKLDYFSDIEDVITQMKELKEDEYSLYHENVRKAFGYDNETIFSFKLKKGNAPFINIPECWHYQDFLSRAKALEKGTSDHGRALDKFKAECSKDNVVLVHFISKNFGLVFDT